MEKVIVKCEGRSIEIDACRELAIWVRGDLGIGAGNDGFCLVEHDVKKAYKMSWDSLRDLIKDCRWDEMDELARIRFLESIGAVPAGMSTSGPSFLIYPRRNAKA